MSARHPTVIEGVGHEAVPFPSKNEPITLVEHDRAVEVPRFWVVGDDQAKGRAGATGGQILSRGAGAVGAHRGIVLRDVFHFVFKSGH